MVAATVPFSENCTQAAGVGTPVLAVGFSALMLKGICTVTATYPAPHPRGRVTSAQFFNGSTAKIGIETDGLFCTISAVMPASDNGSGVALETTGVFNAVPMP